MPLTPERMQEIMVDATLHSSREDYSEDELEFRRKIDVDVTEAEAKGWMIDFTSELT